MLAKSEYQADCQSPEPTKSIRYFCKHNIIGKTVSNLQSCLYEHFSKIMPQFHVNLLFEINFKILQQLFIDFFFAVPCCEFEKFCWKCKLLRDWSLAKQTRSFIYVIFTSILHVCKNRSIGALFRVNSRRNTFRCGFSSLYKQNKT